MPGPPSYVFEADLRRSQAELDRASESFPKRPVGQNWPVSWSLPALLL